MLNLQLIDELSQHLIVVAKHLIAMTWTLDVEARSCHPWLHKCMMSMVVIPVLLPEVLYLSHFYLSVHII